MDTPAQSPYAASMAEPFVLRERWFDVSLAEFEAFLRNYPRPLEARPPLNQKPDFREWLNLSMGTWPGSAVGKSWKRGGASATRSAWTCYSKCLHKNDGVASGVFRLSHSCRLT